MSRKESPHSASRRKAKDDTVIPAMSKRRQASPPKVIPAPDDGSQPPMRNWTRFAFLIILGTAVAAGMALMVHATRQGIGVITDSTTYISVARSLLRGTGFTQATGVPLTHYPPLYPALLALSGLFGGDLLAGAKWLHHFLYAANILMVGVLVYRGTRGSLMATTIALLFVLASGHFLYYHVMTLSEAPFLFFTLGGLVLINEYLYHNRLYMLVGASVVIGLACLTRYVGVSLIVVLFVTVVLLDQSDLRRKITNIAILVSIYSMPLVLWIIRNIMISDTLVNRRITFHPMSLDQIEGAVNTISAWFCIPQSFNVANNLLILLIIIAIALILLFKMAKRFGFYSDLNRIPLLSMIFLFLYTGTLVLSIFFVEANLPFDNRILFPFHIVLMIGLVTLVRNAFHLTAKSPWLVVVAIMLCTPLLMSWGHVTVLLAGFLSENGVVGFNNKTWKSSKAMEFVRGLPEGTLIYSNGPDVIDFQTGRQIMMIPGKGISSTDHQNLNFLRDIEDMMQRLESSRGFLVYFNGITWRGYLPGAEALKQGADLRSVYEGKDGTIYQVDGLKSRAAAPLCRDPSRSSPRFGQLPGHDLAEALSTIDMGFDFAFLCC